MEGPAVLPMDDHHVLLSPQRWKRRIALWSGAVLVALAAILFARASDYCYELFKHLLAHSRYWPLLVTPIGFALLAWLAQRFGYRDPASISRFALAGGAAGIAAAFNAPLAGVLVAIEELASACEHRFSGALLTAMMLAGVVPLGLVGN